MTQRQHKMRETKIESKFFPIDLKAVDADGTFEGYASLFERIDLGRDIIARGAFAESLRQRGARGVRMLFQHNPAEPIGAWTHLEEDRRGLKARGRLTQDVARAREVLALMRAGALDGLSIGFRTLVAHKERQRGVRRIAKLDLWEISVVTFPMLPGARVERIKSWPFAGQAPSEREFERWLTRDAGLTRVEARAVARNGLTGLRSLRDAGGGNQKAAQLAEQFSEAARFLRRN
ncbi:MAG: HK97 family phage prohead protease [Filomicrobium sp.]